VKDKSKKNAFKNPTFSMFTRWTGCTVKILEDFTEGNSRKSRMKPYKRSKKQDLFGHL